jgi:hypothetical protein
VFQIEIVSTISIAALARMARGQNEGKVKAVVDVTREVMAVNGMFHYAEIEELIRDESVAGDLWGVDLVPAKHGTGDFIIFEAAANIRPGVNNSHVVLDPSVRASIASAVGRIITG